MKRMFWGLGATFVICLGLGSGLAVADEPPVEPPVAEPPVAPAPVEPAPIEALPSDLELEVIEDDTGRPATIDVVADIPAPPRAIIGPEPEEALRTVPGSGQSLSLKDLRLHRKPEGLMQAVRGLPGVHVRDEVSQGIVPNIGIRGLNPDRSEKILILEDGVLAGLAPYSVNAAYYVPPFERMARIELLKGSGQILYGPHTVGGVLNLVTREIGCCPSGYIELVGGTHGYMMGHAMYSARTGPLGYQLSVLHKSGDGTKGDSEFDIQDINAKFQYHFTRNTNITLKLSHFDSEVETTYLGLTQPMFDARPLQNPADHDLLEVEWYGAHLTLQHKFCEGLELTTHVYMSDAERNWNRQDFRRNNGFAAPPGNLARTDGDVTVDGGALYLRESFGARDRKFFKWGVEPRLLAKHRVFGREAELQVGARFHQEKFINERNNRATLISAPVTRNREVNRVDAWSGFIHEKVQLSRRFSLSGGVRLESWTGERQFDVQNNLPVDFSEDTSTTELIPGAGATYELCRGTTLFGGVHRGFAPPRITDSIDSTGTDLQLDAERSWNYELGVRGQPTSWLSYELTGFYMDFENKIIPANESGGASTSNTNAGESEHLGFEVGFRADMLALTRGCRQPRCAPRLWLDAGYTFVHTENKTVGGIFSGNELPYAPQHILRAGLAFEDPRTNITAGAWATYTAEQFADQANTVAASNDGTNGLIPDYWLVDASVSWRLPRSSLTVTLSVNNVFDERYIASRAPSGIHVGAPRHGFLGLRLDL